MPWVEERKVGDRVHRYVVWRERVRGEDGRLRWKRRSKPVGEVPREAAAAMAVEHGVVALGLTPRPAHVGPSAALTAFLDEWRDVRRRKAETVDYYRGLLEPCFAALAARGPLRSWQPRWVVEYVAGHPGWSPRTVQMLLVALRTFAKWARRRGYDCPDLARDVEGPRVTKAQRQAYSVGELRLILAAAVAHPYAPAVYLAALAGLSLGDLRRLTWGEVDLRGGWIRAQRSKTGRDLLVPIGPRLRAVLKAVPPGEATATVCSLPASDSSAYKGWARLCAAAGVPSRGGWKRLRHTYATLLDAAGVDSATRRDLMAHAPGSRMTDLYTHTDRGRLKAGIAAVERAVRP